MFPIKVKHVEERPEDSAVGGTAWREALKMCKELSYAGYGCYSRAYTTDNLPFVLKVSNQDVGYLSFLHVIQELGIQNRWLPRIIDVTIFRDPTSIGKYTSPFAVRLEKLKKGHYDSPWSTAKGTVFEHQCRFIRHLVDGVAPPWPIDPEIEELVAILQLARERAKPEKEAVKFDLHCENFMLRDNGDVVVIDPLA